MVNLLNKSCSRFLLSLLICLLILPELSADPVDDILSEVDSAVFEESYTTAISLIEEGKRRFPEDPRLPMKAGQLYKDRELYQLALAEFKSAEVLNPLSPDMLHEMAGTYGYLGNNDSAVEILERLLELDNPEYEDRAIDDLSWMYFKTYRMDDGINLLEKALAGSFDRNWAHTLGTLYAGMYDPEKSRQWYMRSIEDALDNGDEFFASVAHYNLSLLEFSFYLYEDSREQAIRSLELRSRAGGHMVIGELDFLAWKLNDALEAYRKAESMDQTPLSRMDMGSFYQRIGYLDEAIRFIQEIQKDPDDSWMYHYGVDRTRFGIDLNEISGDSWTGKANVEALTPRSGVRQRLESLIRRTVWRFRGLYHDRKNRALTVKYAKELGSEGNELDAAWNSSAAARGYRRITLYHLEEARLIETSLTGRSVPWYGLEIGREAGDNSLVFESMDAFSVDEGDPVEQSLRFLSRDLPSKYLAELYKMNPGGLRQYGLILPIELHVSGEQSGRIARRLKALLRRTGYHVTDSAAGFPGSARLTVSRGEAGELKWFMSDPEGRTRSNAESESGISRSSLTPVLSGILDRFYFTRLGDTEE